MNTSTSFTKFATGLAAGIMGLSLSCSSAAVLFQDDFETDTIGQNPTGWTITDSPPTGPDISVVSGSSTGGTAPNLQVLNFNSNGSTATYMAVHGFTSTSVGTVEFSFSMRFNSITTEANPFIQISGAAAAGYIGAQNLTTTGRTAGFYYYSNGDGNAVSILSDVIESDWYRVKLTINLDTDRWSFRVDNLNNAAAGQHAFVDNLLFWQPTNYINGIKFQRANDTGNFDIDDVLVQTIPEPTTAGLVFGSALVLGLTRRKRRA